MPPKNPNAEKKKERLIRSTEKYIASLQKVSGALLMLYGGEIPYTSEARIAYDLIKGAIVRLKWLINKQS